MKKILFAALLLVPMLGQAQVWQETFDGLANGSTSDAGTTAWSTILPSGGAASFSKQTPVAGYEVFLINNTTNEGVWQSAVVDIASLAEVAIEITLYSNFTFASDYIRCYYKINGGTEVLFGELQGNNGLNISSAASAIVSGNTLQIVVRGMDNTAGTTGGIINGLAFDNIAITNITVLYSRNSGNWTTGDSWSTESFGGASCSCTPNNNSQVIIGNNRTISIPGAATAAGITVQNSGHLQFTGNTTLTMARGGSITVEAGGVINNNGGNGNILYGAYAYSLVVNGSLTVTTLTANTGSNITFSGAGQITTNDFLIGSGGGRTITLNTSGGFTINNDLNFQSSSTNVAFLNHRALTVGNRLLFASSNVSFTNNSTLNAGSLVINASTNNNNTFTNSASASLNVGSINANSGDFILNNYGTITQTGNFSNIDAGSYFRNQNGSTWNFSGGGTNSRLFCDFGTNLFNYTSADSQNIITPADAYSNLSLSGSGIKTLSGNLDINGDLNISASARLDASVNSYMINIGGNWNTTSSDTNAFSERTGTVTFDGLSAQNISATAGTETFYNLTINKATNNVIQSSTDLVVSNTLTLTSGGLSINGRTLNLTQSSPSAIARTNGCIISETTTLPYSNIKWSVGTSTGSFTFPFGKTRAVADYIPFTFNVTSSGVSSGTVSVMTYASTTDNTPWPSTVMHLNNSTGMSNASNVVDRFWFITLDGYTTNPVSTVTFTATPEEVGSLGTLRAQRWNSSTGGWDPPKSGQTNSTVYSATVPSVNQFSPWTMSGNNVVLPVELIAFDARLQNGTVKLEWQTTHERNHRSYSVQKSADMESYEEITSVRNTGSSGAVNTYQAEDKTPYYGRSYYRLKQIDIDGKTHYFKPVMIENNEMQNGVFIAYPIPSKGSSIKVRICGLQAHQQLNITLKSMMGQTLYARALTSDHTGNIDQELTFGTPLPPGLYFIQAGSPHKLIRFIVE
jgi:hypothetical protein